MYSDKCQIEMMDGTSEKTSEFENKSSKYAIYFLFPTYAMYKIIYV